MSNAGYGNHDETPAKVGERASPEAASAKPGAGSTDRPGMDLGGAGDLSAAQGQMAGSRSTPDPQGKGPHAPTRDSNSPTLTDDNQNHDATPGTGALPGGGTQGGDVDPGAG